MKCGIHLTDELRKSVASLADNIAGDRNQALISAAKAQIRLIQDTMKADQKLLDKEKARILKAWIKESNSAGGLQKTVIGKGSTGEVVRIGDEAIKRATGNEGEIYKQLSNIEGIAKGYEKDGKIHTPIYNQIISVDTIESDKRALLAPLISKSVNRINAAVSALIDVGYDYNDPLQFGLNKERKLDLMDFSNAQKADEREVLSNNIMLLSQFYKQFGLKRQANAVSQVRDVLLNQRLHVQFNGNPLLGDEYDGVNYRELTDRLDGKQASNAYYTTNARYVQLKDIAQTDNLGDEKVKTILSNRPLTEKEISTWELIPVVTLLANDLQKAKATVKDNAKQDEAKGRENKAKTAYVSWAVNYSESNKQRTTETKVFKTLAEAKEFAQDKAGYIIRMNDGGNKLDTKDSSRKLVEFFGGFVPSAQEEQTIKSIVDSYEGFSAAKKQAEQGKKPESNDNADATSVKFSKETTDDQAKFAARALEELAKEDDFFRLPISDSVDIEELFKEIFPKARYRAWQANKNRHMFVLPPSETKGNMPFYVYEKDGKLWIDVSQLDTGSGGSAIYFAVGNYAKNTGQVFVGDPDGLSMDATIRRTANMLSLALRFGSTDFMEPAKEQLQGYDEKGIEPLEWKKGDTEFNIRELIKTFLGNIHNQFPEIKNARYDFKTGQFFDPEGEPLEDGFLDGIREGAFFEGARKARAGSTTTRQAILIQSIASSESSERPDILGQLLYRNSTLGQRGLGKLFSKGEKSGSTVEQIKPWLPRRVRRMLVAGKLKIVQSVEDLPAHLRQTGNALFHAAWHGSPNPNTFDRFDLSYIGQGQGQSSYGYGVNITSSEDIAKYYQGRAGGHRYKLDAFPMEEAYLDWDTPIGRQSQFVQDKLAANGITFTPGEKLNVTGRKIYGDLVKKYWKWGQPEIEAKRQASEELLRMGIPGTKWRNPANVNVDGQPRGKGAYNFVVFNPNDLTITERYSKLAGVQGLYDAKTDTVYLVADMLDKGTLNSIISHELYHRGLATDDKLKSAHERFESFLKSRFEAAKKGLGSAIEKEAYQRVVNAKTPAKDQLEEFSAYLISAHSRNPDTITGALKKAIQDFIAAIRAFLIRNGLDLGYIKTLTPADLMAMGRYGAKVTSGYNGLQAVTSGYNTDIRYSMAAPITNTVKQGDEWLKSWLDGIDTDKYIYNLQDRFIDLKRQIEKVVKNGGTITDEINAYQKEELYHQRVASRIKEFEEQELQPILQGLHDSGISLDTFQTFLHARHAPSRNAEMARRNPNQEIIDANLADAEANLEAVRSNPASSPKEISAALAEYNKWRKAKPFKGTEEERLSLSGMSNQEARDFMAGLNAQEKSKLESLGNKIDAINNKTLDIMVEYGMETEETIEAMRNQWQHYVPLNRDEAHQDDAFGKPIGRGFSIRGSGIKSATGSNAEVTNILAHIAEAREQMLKRGEKNKVSRALADFIEANPDDDFATVDKVEIEDKLNDDGLVVPSMEPLFKRNQKDNVVMFRIDGKDHAIVFNERKPENVRLAMSLKNLDGANLDFVENLIAKGTRWFAKVNTQYNVVFGVINLMRDVQGMALNLTNTPLDGKQWRVMKRMTDAAKAIGAGERGWKVDPKLKAMYERFNKAGGTTGYAQMFDDIQARNNHIQKEFEKYGWNKPHKIANEFFKWLSDYNTLLENSTRLAVFMEAVNSGLSDDKAASLAKNITVNFNRRGAYGMKIGAFYAFFNASAQGTARIVQTLKGPKGMQIMKQGVALGALTTLLGIMMMGEDDWEKIPEFVRERSLILPLGGSQYISIPMPLGFHILPNIGRKAVESVLGSNRISKQQRLLQLAGSTVGAFNPLGGSDIHEFIMPTVLDPALALWRNKDWTGTSIYREDFNSLRPTPGFTRKKDTASIFGEVAAEFANKATGGTDYKQGLFSPTPDQIDYLLGQIFGGSGREILKTIQAVKSVASDEELPTYKIPLAGRLYGKTSGNSVERGAYYDNLKRLHEHEAELKGLRSEGKPITQYLKDNPDARLTILAKGVEKTIKKLQDSRKVLKEKGLSTRAIDSRIAEQMKRLNDAVAKAIE